MRHLIDFTRTMLVIGRVVWRLREKPILHWHIVGMLDKQSYRIVWRHLHRAELGYKCELELLEKKRVKKFMDLLNRQANSYYPIKKK